VSDTAKIVYNGCFGGFGLSIAAQLEYAKRKGFSLYFYKQTACRHRDGRDEYTRLDEGRDLFASALKRDLGPVCAELPNCDGDWFWDKDIPRNDADLVAVVEMLGDAASGECARLKIAEVPKGTLYRIDEYDGRESVMTNADYEWSVA
jgi:hypothetical protein